MHLFTDTRCPEGRLLDYALFTPSVPGTVPAGMNEQITTQSSVIRNHSSILESWYKFKMMPYADFNICWFQLCAHIQIVPICCLNVWVAKSHTWGDERRTGIAFSLNVEAFLEKKKKSRLSLLFKIVWLWFCDGSGSPLCFHRICPSPAFLKTGNLLWVLAQLDLCPLN